MFVHESLLSLSALFPARQEYALRPLPYSLPSTAPTRFFFCERRGSFIWKTKKNERWHSRARMHLPLCFPHHVCSSASKRWPLLRNLDEFTFILKKDAAVALVTLPIGFVLKGKDDVNNRKYILNRTSVLAYFLPCTSRSRCYFTTAQLSPSVHSFH